MRQYPINLFLDLRKYSRRLENAQGFIELWARLSPALRGKRLELGRAYSLTDQCGEVAFTVIAPDEGVAEVTDDTDFAIHSVLEPAALRYACDLCRSEGRSTYGPFVCQLCRDRGLDGRVCDEHVVILDGSMRSHCKLHAPRCECGRPATFWCQGTNCRRKRAWCEQHRHAHRNDPDHSYCESCYALAFPRCEQAGCERVGSLACEFVDPVTLATCGRKACPAHMHRWQIYGAEEEGLTLCSQHRGVGTLDDPRLIAEIILGTAARRIVRHRAPLLPTLQKVRHILLHVRNRNYELPVIDHLFEQFPIDLRKAPELHREVTSLLQRHKSQRIKDIERDEAEKSQGRVHFERLRQLLIERGQSELASVVSFRDYRPKWNKLFVDVPTQYKGRFFGKEGRNIKELSASLGVEIKPERDSQERPR